MGESIFAIAIGVLLAKGACAILRRANYNGGTPEDRQVETLKLIAADLHGVLEILREAKQ